MGMGGLTRREFLKSSERRSGGDGGLGGLCQQYRRARGQARAAASWSSAAGGAVATAAKYVRIADPTIEVVLLEPTAVRVLPLQQPGPERRAHIDSLRSATAGLRDRGVKVRHEMATAIEPDTKRVRVGEGYLTTTASSSRPAVDFQLEQVEGLPPPETRCSTRGRPDRRPSSWRISSRRCPTAACSC
jgi:sulfide dehydrogenase [flavocytochrome c] flavoprotein subunit